MRNDGGFRFWVCYDRYRSKNLTERVVVFRTNMKELAEKRLRELEITGDKEYYLIDFSDIAEEI